MFCCFQTGLCGIPPGLVQRYAEELKRDVREVAEALDHTRLHALETHNKPGVPNDFLGDACISPNLSPSFLSLQQWLVSLGLPMYTDLIVSDVFFFT